LWRTNYQRNRIFLRVLRIFPCQYHPTRDPYSFVYNGCYIISPIHSICK
jgi:hypothetical protein